MTATTSRHQFDLATELTALGDGYYAGHTAAEYDNMVGPFGGVTAATLLRAAQLDSRCLSDPLALTVNFAGPITAGLFTITAEPARTKPSHPALDPDDEARRYRHHHSDRRLRHPSADLVGY